MIHIESLDDGLELFCALGSSVRVDILKLLLKNGSLNINELAKRLNVTSSALTNHIKKLESCGLIEVSNVNASHGNQKVCSIVVDKILIDLIEPVNPANQYQVNIGIGQYTSYDVYPTCGIATPQSLIGEVDDTRFFAHPDRYKASILWFTKGFVEYQIPNFLPRMQTISQIMVSAELSSEAPGVNDNWPSDISFYINGTRIGNWTSPGDFGDRKGIFTPNWWFPNWNQYGLLKLLLINRKGTFVDGLQVSNVTIQDLHLDTGSKIMLRMAVEDNARHVGGLTIFGKGFGNYAQDIKVSVSYDEDSDTNPHD